MANQQVNPSSWASNSQRSHPYAKALAPKFILPTEQATKDPPGWIEFASKGSIAGEAKCRPRAISVQISCAVYGDTIQYSGRIFGGDDLTDVEAAAYRRGVTMVANKSDILFSAIPHASARLEKKLGDRKISKDSKQLSLDAAAKVIAVLQRMYKEASDSEISKPRVAQFNPTHPDSDDVTGSQPQTSTSPTWELQRATQSNFVKDNYEQFTNSDSALPRSKRENIWRNPNGETILIHGAHSINSAADNRIMRASAPNGQENNVQPILGLTTRQWDIPRYVGPRRPQRVSDDQPFDTGTKQLKWVPERFPTPAAVPKSAIGCNELLWLPLHRPAVDTQQVVRPDSLCSLGDDERPLDSPPQSRFFSPLPLSVEDIQDPRNIYANDSQATGSTVNLRDEHAGNYPPEPDPRYLNHNPSVFGAPYSNPPPSKHYRRADRNVAHAPQSISSTRSEVPQEQGRHQDHWEVAKLSDMFPTITDSREPGPAYPSAVYPLLSNVPQQGSAASSTFAQPIAYPPSSAEPVDHFAHHGLKGTQAPARINHLASPAPLQGSEDDLAPRPIEPQADVLRDDYPPAPWTLPAMPQTTQSHMRESGHAGNFPAPSLNSALPLPVEEEWLNSPYSRRHNTGTGVRVVDPKLISHNTELKRKIDFNPYMSGTQPVPSGVPWPYHLAMQGALQSQPTSSTTQMTGTHAPSLNDHLIHPVGPRVDASGKPIMDGADLFGGHRRRTHGPKQPRGQRSRGGT